MMKVKSSQGKDRILLQERNTVFFAHMVRAGTLRHYCQAIGLETPIERNSGSQNALNPYARSAPCRRRPLGAVTGEMLHSPTSHGLGKASHQESPG